MRVARGQCGQQADGVGSDMPWTGFRRIGWDVSSKDTVQVQRLKYTVMIRVGGWTGALNYRTCEILNCALLMGM
jgi:hypothetical protein